MLAYVELVQRKEKEIGCDVLTHQKWYNFPAYGSILLTSRDFLGVAPITSTVFWQVCRPVLPARPPLVKIPQNTPSEHLPSPTEM